VKRTETRRDFILAPLSLYRATPARRSLFELRSFCYQHELAEVPRQLSLDDNFSKTIGSCHGLRGWARSVLKRLSTIKAAFLLLVVAMLLRHVVKVVKKHRGRSGNANSKVVISNLKILAISNLKSSDKQSDANRRQNRSAR
jgi:hypothetical protein